MDNINLPIQMITLVNTDGSLRPIRFRYEDDEHSVQTIDISEVVSGSAIQFLGIDTYAYICKAVIDGIEKMYEVRYHVSAHKWVLFKIIY